MSEYRELVELKARTNPPQGFEPTSINTTLFDWQHVVVEWACRRGRSALFEDCGLGKTRQQLAWADQVRNYTNMPVLIFAPIAVSQQTAREAQAMGLECLIVSNSDECPGNAICISNYEKLHNFDMTRFGGIVLDESSILKSKDGKTRTALIESCQCIPFRLACTATPSPNDHTELGNHAEFLGVCTSVEMLATYFINDAAKTGDWRLKGHAQTDFWRWVASWAVMMRTPADIGYSDDGYQLPPLEIYTHAIETGIVADGELFTTPASTLSELRQARNETKDMRLAKAKELIDNDSQWLVWVEKNDESDEMAQCPGACEVAGQTPPELKAERMLGFADGAERVLVTKPKMAGFGMNWQNCHHMVFVGLSHSFEQFYQAVRRCHRFGQSNPVQVHIITTDRESTVLASVMDKQRKQDEMVAGMVAAMKDTTMSQIKGDTAHEMNYTSETSKGDKWTMHLGDCVETVSKFDSDSVGYSIFSPPFASLYTYSDSPYDMGNCTNHEDFMVQFRHLVNQLYRVLMPGRNVSFHCMNLPTSKVRDGHIGIVDFRGLLLREFQDAGFIFHSEVCIWKDPVTAMQRTKALGLLHKTIRKDSSMSRQGIPDYLVTMRKPGDNPVPIPHGDDLPVGLWQQYASPVWMDINQSDTLQYRSAREHNDEKHICPLQLEVIKRGLHLWSAPGDLVLSPFAGIGSEGYMSVKHGCRFVGCELKRSYYEQACRNLASIEQETTAQTTILDILGVS